MPAGRKDEPTILGADRAHGPRYLSQDDRIYSDRRSGVLALMRLSQTQSSDRRRLYLRR
jgi:hypothetical protein